MRARPDLDDREIAIACASHLARPEQLDAVRALLAAAPATEDDLETGPEPSPIEHNCSGKHAGFLAVCRARGFETRGYRLATHPLQEELLARSRPPPRSTRPTIPVAIDGCGVPTFALPLDRCAHAFARLPRPRRRVARDRGDARPPGDAPRPDRRRCDVRSRARRLGCEGRSRGSLLRLFARRPGGRAEGRGRCVSRPFALHLRPFWNGSASPPASSASSPWKTAAARRSGSSRARPESRVPKRRSRV